MAEMFDHVGNPVAHGRVYLKEVRAHYVTAGQGERLLLLRETPKNTSTGTN